MRGGPCGQKLSGFVLRTGEGGYRESVLEEGSLSDLIFQTFLSFQDGGCVHGREQVQGPPALRLALRGD